MNSRKIKPRFIQSHNEVSSVMFDAAGLEQQSICERATLRFLGRVQAVGNPAKMLDDKPKRVSQVSVHCCRWNACQVRQLADRRKRLLFEHTQNCIVDYGHGGLLVGLEQSAGELALP
jgi:hypothetical protein